MSEDDELAADLWREALHRYHNDTNLHYTADVTARILRHLRHDMKTPWPDDLEHDNYIAALALLLVERDFYELRKPRAASVSAGPSLTNEAGESR